MHVEFICSHVGCNIPVNSVGQLPSQVLNLSDSQKAGGMLSNVKQINEQYKAHEQNIMDTSFSFQRYSDIEENQGICVSVTNSFLYLLFSEIIFAKCFRLIADE